MTKKIYVVTGIPGAGKSHFIDSQLKEGSDIYVDLRELQQTHKDIIEAEYLFYAEIERYLRETTNKNSRLILETVLAKSFRRRALLRFFKTLAEGLQIEVEFHLILIHPSKNRYYENLRARFPYRTSEGDLYERQLELYDSPSKEEGWDEVKIYCI